MRRPPARRETIQPTTLPPVLRVRLEEAIEMARRDAAQIPEAARLPSMELRKLVRAELTSGGAGCAVFCAAFLIVKLLGTSRLEVTWIGTLVFASVCAAVAAGSQWLLGAGGPFRRDLRHRSPAILAAAAEFAGFGDLEWAAIAAVQSPRAGVEVRAEIDRLLMEDVRLVTALAEIGAVDLDPIEADRLRLRLALARETDPATRTALEASLALCVQRHEAAMAGLAVQTRIDAHRELILQTLRSAGESLTRREPHGEDLAVVRENASALGAEVAAIEQAVQEMRG